MQSNSRSLLLDKASIINGHYSPVVTLIRVTNAVATD
jgi:hypothetical protein